MASPRLRHRVVQPGLTGTSTRMKSLPHANISSVDFHPKSDSALTKAVPVGDNVNATEVPNRDKQTTRKCVYTYEDKYTFARILTADSLVFDSHFESGNLHSAFRIHPNPELGPVDQGKQIYDLYMHPDVHTSGHTQWFYFSVSNTQIGREVVFNLRNFAKPDSMFNKGMQPLYLSVTSKSKKWRRCGYDITYFGPIANNNFAEDAKKKRKKGQPAPGMYTMTFAHIFNKADDQVYFAFCHPYTYTDLQRYLILMERRVLRKGFNFRRRTLCRTLAGNECDVLTITAPAVTREELTSRVLAIITCRVHPGETNSSWMMQGVLDFLSGDSTEAQLLRSLYVFKIVPMLNPDGVVNGNYRTSLSGSDLNRRWCKPDRVMHPTIYHTKEMIRRLKAIYPESIIMDLHGHSTKEGIFIYGCVPDRRSYRPASPRRTSSDSDLEGTATAESSRLSGSSAGPGGPESKQPTPSRPTRPPPVMHIEGCGYVMENSNSGVMVPSREPEPLPPMRSRTPSPAPPVPGEVKPDYVRASTVMRREFLEWKVKLFPRMLATISDVFVFNSCSFKVHRSKASTMRIVNFIELGVDCVYTIEASLAGLRPDHFGANCLVKFGSDICRSLLEIYPMLAPRTSPHLVSSAYMNRKPAVAAIVDNNSTGMTFEEELSKYRDLSVFDDQSIGVALMSETVVRDLITAAVDGEGRDDDDSDIDEVDDGKGVEEKETVSKSSKKKTTSKVPKAKISSKISNKPGKDKEKDTDKEKEKEKDKEKDKQAEGVTKAKKKDKEKKTTKDKEKEKGAGTNKLSVMNSSTLGLVSDATLTTQIVSAASVTAELRRPPLVPKSNGKNIRRKSNLAAAVEIYASGSPSSVKVVRKSWDDIAALSTVAALQSDEPTWAPPETWTGAPPPHDDLAALELEGSHDNVRLPLQQTTEPAAADRSSSTSAIAAERTDLAPATAVLQGSAALTADALRTLTQDEPTKTGMPIEVGGERRTRSLTRVPASQRSASPGGSLMASAGAEALRGGARLAVGMTPTIPSVGLREDRPPAAMSADTSDVRPLPKKPEERRLSMPTASLAGKSFFASMIDNHHRTSSAGANAPGAGRGDAR